MSLQREDESGFKFYTSLDDIKKDGYTPIKVFNALQFYRLVGKRTVLVADNLEPMVGVTFVIEANIKKDIYYVREFRGYSLNELFWYRKDLTFSGENESVLNLWRYIDDGRLYLLFNDAMVKEMKEMLRRVYKSKFNEEGVLDYRLFIQIMELSLKYEDYREYGSSLLGFKTVCKQFSDSIDALWEEARKKNNP